MALQIRKKLVSNFGKYEIFNLLIFVSPIRGIQALRYVAFGLVELLMALQAYTANLVDIQKWDLDDGQSEVVQRGTWYEKFPSQ